MKSPATAPRPKNRLLAQMRRLHLWFGVTAALFLLVFGLTGVVLNYKKPIFTALGLEPKPTLAPPDDSGGAVAPPKRPTNRADDGAALPFTTATGLAAAAVTPDAALHIAQRELGEVPLERIELRRERDELIWKIKSRAGHEVLINALTGRAGTKGAYEKLGPPDANGQPSRSFDWGKFLLDLHTGKIGGEVGKAVMTVAAGGLLFLTVSGLYLWLKPLLIRRGHARGHRTVPATASGLPGHAPVRQVSKPDPISLPEPVATVGESAER